MTHHHEVGLDEAVDHHAGHVYILSLEGPLQAPGIVLTDVVIVKAKCTHLLVVAVEAHGGIGLG